MATAFETPAQIDYIGEELELFKRAENWKRYVASRLRPFLSGDLLEVGAGIGANTHYFDRPELTRFVSLEPDGRLCEEYQREQAAGRVPSRCELIQGTLETLARGERFDTIVYDRAATCASCAPRTTTSIRRSIERSDISAVTTSGCFERSPSSSR